MNYWVDIDFGSDHQVAFTEEKPAVTWHGPFTSWGEVEGFMWNTAMLEIEGIRSVRDGWTGLSARATGLKAGNE